MLYKVTYKRRSDRAPTKWTEYSEILTLNEACDLLKWLDKTGGHALISVVPMG